MKTLHVENSTHVPSQLKRNPSVDNGHKGPYARCRHKNPIGATTQTPLPVHPSWPRPSSYTREFRALDWAAASWGSALGLRARGCGACRLRQWPFTVPDLRLYGNTYSLTSTVDGTPIHYSFKSFTLDGREQRDLSRRPRKRGRSEQPRARRWWWALYELVHHTSIRFEWC